MRRRLATVVIGAFIVLTGGTAAAGGFTHQGFVQGMDEREATILTSQLGMRFHLIDPSASRMKQYLVGENQDIAVFCGGRLAAYRISDPANFQRFVNTLIGWKSQGYEVIGASPDSFFGPDGKNYTRLDVALGRGGDGFMVYITLNSIDASAASSQTEYRALEFEERCH